MPRDWVRDAIKRDVRRAEAAKRGGFGSIHRPRSRQEKKIHVETLDKVPFELVPAMEARRGGVLSGWARLRSLSGGSRVGPLL